MNAGKRASVATMNNPPPTPDRFKRQVSVRVSPEESALLEAAAREHGSNQAALIAGLRALSPIPEKATNTAQAPKMATTEKPAEETPSKTAAATNETPQLDPNEEILARQAAALLGLEISTVKGYIRSGRIDGRYDQERGWITTRRAVQGYAKRQG